MTVTLISPEIYFETPHYVGRVAVLPRLDSISDASHRGRLAQSGTKVAFAATTDGTSSLQIS